MAVTSEQQGVTVGADVLATTVTLRQGRPHRRDYRRRSVPHGSSVLRANTRPVKSMPPPGAEGTINRIGFEG
jgi:hypothetical protein